MSAIILRNEIIHYEALGRGRPILFLHDWVGSWRYWIPTMQSASISYRTYALDLWGFGDTAKKANYYSIEQQTILLDEFIRELGIGKVALVGHGLGAIIAILYTLRNLNKVDRVVAVSLPNSESDINPRIQSDHPSELVDWLLDRSPLTEAAYLEAPKADQKAILLSLTTLQDVDLPNLGRKISTMCLLIHGQNDQAVTPPQSDQINSLPDKVHLILFPQSRHFPMLEEPRKFNRLLIDFFSLPSGESPKKLQVKKEWKRRVR